MCEENADKTRTNPAHLTNTYHDICHTVFLDTFNLRGICRFNGFDKLVDVYYEILKRIYFIGPLSSLRESKQANTCIR